MRIYYLSVDDVLEIHQQATGLVDALARRDVLESAVAAPQANMFQQDLYPDLYTKAAALLRSLSLNHAFVDGNKRAAWVSTRTFLLVNGIDVRTSASVVESLLLGLISGQVTFDDITIFFVRRGRRSGDEQTFSLLATTAA